MDRMIMERVAKAAHFALNEEEIERYCKDFDELFNRLNMIDGAPEGEGHGVNPLEVGDVLRDDVPGIFFDPYELLKDMKTYENYVRGPRVL
ncbi:MAG: aspartyl/glutamyl-tRNA amidotransferase subunit C [Methanomassiliicoccaceae archaeon]|nr:aspartyl/glutamyl-tRNA amidotransferase subunit C [Methanomassiliicoccaceae archaeon]